MKIVICYPPLNGPGTPMLGQNRQFQWFHNPAFIYPVVPAYAATLLKNAGAGVFWLDAVAEGLSEKKFYERLGEISPDLIFFETKTPVVKQHWALIRKIKAAWPQTICVLAGDHVTALPEESFENSAVDYVLTGGDYDFLLLNLYRHLQSGTPLEKGIYFRENGAVKNTGVFELKHDLAELPLIDRELTRWRLYSEKNGNYLRTPGAYIMAGRDCWYHRCTFCSWTTTYPVFRVRPVAKVLDEIGDLIENFGVREIMDDSGCFPVGPWLKEFCEGLIERGYHRKIYFDCNMRFGALSFEEYQLMKKAGFRLILFGLESANQKTLDKIAKGVTVEKIVESCGAAAKAKLWPHLTIMFGYPWESEAEAQRTLELGYYLMKKGLARTLQATIVIPYPGTPLFKECQKKGWLKSLNWEDYDMRGPMMKVPFAEAKINELVRKTYRVAFAPEFIGRTLINLRTGADLKFLFKAARGVVGHLLDFK